MKKKLLICLFIYSVFQLLNSCSNHDGSPVSPGDNKLKIISFSPGEALPGSLVTVDYSDDTRSKGNPAFFIGDVEVKEEKNTYHKGTITSYLRLNDSVKTGRIKIFQSTYSDSSENPLIILDKGCRPVISDFSPRSGQVSSEIVIKGHNFLLYNNIRVFIGNERLLVKDISRDSLYNYIVVVAPSYPVSDYITVISDCGSDKTFYKYVNSDSSRIVIYDFEPKQGIAGTPVTIKAVLPDTVISNYTVLFGNLKADISSITRSGKLSLVNVLAPPNVETSHIIIQSRKDTAISQSEFYVNQQQPPDMKFGPRIKDFNPKNGGWNWEVTISGSNFGFYSGDSRVFLGNVECQVKQLTSEQLIVILPSKAAPGKLSVITRFGADTARDIFNYQFISKVGIEIKGIKYKAIRIDNTLNNPIDTTYHDAAFNFTARQFPMQTGNPNNEFIYSIKLDSSGMNLNHSDSIFIKLNYNDQISQIQNFTFYKSHYDHPTNSKSFSSYYDRAFISMKSLALKISDNYSWTFEATGSEIDNLMDKLDTFDETDSYQDHSLRYRQVITKFYKSAPMDNSSFIRVILYR